jgi:hypothetical protein
MINTTGNTKFKIKNDLVKTKEDYVVKKDDGTDFFKIVSQEGTCVVTSMSGEKLAFMIEGQRHTAIYGCECVMTLPHMYIYSFTSFLDASLQMASEFKVDDKPLYPFARIHAEASLNPWKKVQNYEVAYAMNRINNREGERKYNADMFSGSTYLVKKRLQDGTVAFKRDYCFKEEMKGNWGKSYGVAVATKDASDPTLHTIECAANICPVLMACLVMCMESGLMFNL